MFLELTGDYDHDSALCVETAREWLADPTTVILDTETTDLHGYLVQIAVIDVRGAVLLDTLVNPQAKIAAKAQQVHGLSTEKLAGAPTYAQLHEQILGLLTGRRVVIYNAAFDRAVLVNEWDRLTGSHKQASAWDASLRCHCAMDLYSAWCGNWSDYHRSYRWQRLPGGDHSALGDARATLRLLERIAAPVPQA